jgi:hypothetical protein
MHRGNACAGGRGIAVGGSWGEFAPAIWSKHQRGSFVADLQVACCAKNVLQQGCAGPADAMDIGRSGNIVGVSLLRTNSNHFLG